MEGLLYRLEILGNIEIKEYLYHHREKVVSWRLSLNQKTLNFASRPAMNIPSQ